MKVVILYSNWVKALLLWHDLLEKFLLAFLFLWLAEGMMLYSWIRECISYPIWIGTEPFNLWSLTHKHKRKLKKGGKVSIRSVNCVSHTKDSEWSSGQIQGADDSHCVYIKLFLRVSYTSA